MTHDACQPTEDENLDMERDLAVPYVAHRNDIVYLVVLNADLAQELVRWKIVADAGIGAVVQDTMLLCAGFFAQQDSE